MTELEAVGLNVGSGQAEHVSGRERISTDVRTVWNRCLELIQDEIPHQSFHTWFLPIVPLSLDGQKLILRVPSKFFYEWLDQHYKTLLQQCVAEVAGPGMTAEFLIAAASEEGTVPVTEIPVEEVVLKRNSEPASSVATEIRSEVDQRYSLDRFVSNRGYELPAKAATFVSKNYDKTYNPLVFQGEVGSGKTHLLQGIALAINAESIEAKTLLISADRFLHQYVSAAQSGDITAFLNRMIRFDYLLVDNLHRLCGKTHSQEALLFILRELHNRDCQVVLTSNEPPARLKSMNPDLVSFCQQGLIVDLIEYEEETRERIIRAVLNENQVTLDEKSILFLSEHLSSNLHDLRAVMVRIIAQVSLTGRGLRFEEVEYVVSQLSTTSKASESLRPHAKQISIDEILNSAARFFEIPVDILQGVSRKRKIMRARQITIFLCRELTGESLSSIGYHFSNLHHASVLYACNKVSKGIEKSPLIRDTVRKLRNQLGR